VSRFLTKLSRDKRSMDATKAQLLAANELFQNLDADAMAEVSSMTDVTTCPAGQVLFGPENTGEVLFFLKKGHIQIYKLNSEGKKLVLHDLKAGSFFGEMFVLGQGMAENYAEATEESLICAMSRADIYGLLRAKPEVALGVIDHLAEHVNRAESRLETLAHEGLEARLAQVLLQECGPEDKVVRGLSQQDLAERVGATRESVTRMLNQMARSDLVKLGRRKVEVLDVDAVRGLAER